jgi:porphobilinogen deaminase
MGGGCQSPVAAYAEVSGKKLHMRALSFTHGPARHAEAKAPLKEAVDLGQQLATKVKE